MACFELNWVKHRQLYFKSTSLDDFTFVTWNV